MPKGKLLLRCLWKEGLPLHSKTGKISITVQFLSEITQYRTQQIVIFKVLKEEKKMPT